MLGILILLNPFGASGVLMMTIGISLVFDGVSDLVLIHRLTKAFRQTDGDWYE